MSKPERYQPGRKPEQRPSYLIRSIVVQHDVVQIMFKFFALRELRAMKLVGLAYERRL